MSEVPTEEPTEAPTEEVTEEETEETASESASPVKKLFDDPASLSDEDKESLGKDGFDISTAPPLPPYPPETSPSAPEEEAAPEESA